MTLARLLPLALAAGLSCAVGIRVMQEPEPRAVALAILARLSGEHSAYQDGFADGFAAGLSRREPDGRITLSGSGERREYRKPSEPGAVRRETRSAEECRKAELARDSRFAPDPLKTATSMARNGADGRGTQTGGCHE